MSLKISLMETVAGLLVACLASQKHASVFQRGSYADSCTCCHSELEVIKIIITFKGAVRDFLQSPLHREPSPTRTLKWPECSHVQITYNTSSIYHVQHVVLRASWYEGTAQLLHLTDFKLHLFEFYFIG